MVEARSLGGDQDERGDVAETRCWEGDGENGSFRDGGVDGGCVVAVVATDGAAGDGYWKHEKSVGEQHCAFGFWGGLVMQTAWVRWFM